MAKAAEKAYDEIRQRIMEMVSAQAKRGYVDAITELTNRFHHKVLEQSSTRPVA